MDGEQRAILLRFPELSELITHRIKVNEDFEGLCADYEICMNMLTKLAKEAEIKHSKLEEYLEIKKELEKEVLKYIG